MNAEITSEIIRSRNHAPRTGRNRTAGVGWDGAGCGSCACVSADSVVGVSGIPLHIVYSSRPQAEGCVSLGWAAGNGGENWLNVPVGTF